MLIEGKFYPVLLDHRGSIVAAFDKTKTLFIRHYNDWGQKTVEYFSEEARQIERLIVWDFAQMIHNPLLKNDDIYHAAYRSYSPVVGQWASLDPLFMKNPDQLVSLRGNWNPVEYASGDPVNFVDPSGYAGIFIGVGGGGGGSESIGGSGKSTSFDGGLYLGVKPDTQNYVQVGTFVSVTNASIQGGKFGAGFSFGYYKDDVNSSLGGISRVEIETLFIGSSVTGYDNEGSIIYQGISFGGEGFGLSKEIGESRTYLMPLQEHDLNLLDFNEYNMSTYPSDYGVSDGGVMHSNPSFF